jgi:hypothetical protein
MATRTYELIPSFNTAGQFAQSVWHYQFDDAGYTTTQEAARALIDRWDTVNRTGLRACLPSDVTLISYRARLRGGIGGFNAFVPVTSTNTGSRSGTQSASALNPVAIFYPFDPSHGRGKWFIPGVSETDIEDGRFTGTYRNAINTQINAIFDPIVLAGGGGPTATFGWFAITANAFRIATSAALSPNLGTQRRRMRPAG